MTQRLLIGAAAVIVAAIVLAQVPDDVRNDAKSTSNGDAATSSPEVAAVRAALKPLQVVVGQWRGNTFRENVVHESSWAWDHKTDPTRPALVMAAAKNPFFREARVTFDPESEKYVLVLTDPAGQSRRLEGTFSEPPRDVPGDDGPALQRTYELKLEQTEPKAGEQWRVVLDQQENNRFLVELARRRGRAAFRGFDTVSGQREGTRFALSDEGYGEKTCIISGGLGTIAVSHAGRTYYVCCTGCQAAFEDDPEKWIAEFRKNKAK
ncbi:MAG: hypothetical protein WBC44_01030 [Planctomycetaceae bacterium]